MKRTKTLLFALVFALLTVSTGVTFADGHDGGGDIVLFDIVDAADSTTSTDSGRRTGGGADIVVFDLIDAA